MSAKLTFPLCGTPQSAAQAADSARVVEKSVNSVSAFGAKSSVHFLLPEGNPLGGLLLSPPNQVAQPSAALLRYGCGIPLAGTDAGLRRGPPIGELMGCAKPPLQGEVAQSAGGVLAGQRQVSAALRQQARSGGEPVEENALSEMSFQGVDRNLFFVSTWDKALEHRR